MKFTHIVQGTITDCNRNTLQRSLFYTDIYCAVGNTVITLVKTYFAT
jgi:hypothetical protein